MKQHLSGSDVLIVDDEAHLCAILARWLGMEGCHTETALNAAEALKLLEAKPFSLMLCDIMMPGMSGIELLAVVRERHPDLAVIMVTGLDDRDTAIRALELGAYGYIIKPYDRNEIIINMVNALERRRLVMESQEYETRLEEEVLERTLDVRMREEEVALRLVSAAEYRDDETGLHIRRMGLFSAALAEALGWNPEMVDCIRVAAPMHDIGKIGIPDAILQKPGRLTPEEFNIIKSHTTIGAEILGGSQIPLLKMGAEIALCHHEKWDGSGYPRRLSGQDIPLSSRIVAVVDVYDALVHDRVYRPALPEEVALEMMREGRGLHFDPQVLDTFFKTLPDLHKIRSEFKDGCVCPPAAPTAASAGD